MLRTLAARVCSSLLSAASDPCAAGVVRSAAQTQAAAVADEREQEALGYLAELKQLQDIYNARFEQVRHCLHCMP